MSKIKQLCEVMEQTAFKTPRGMTSHITWLPAESFDLFMKEDECSQEKYDTMYGVNINEDDKVQSE